MKPNDLVTWTGRNGETRHGKVVALYTFSTVPYSNLYAKVEWWRQGAKKPRYFTMRQDKLIVK